MTGRSAYQTSTWSQLRCTSSSSLALANVSPSQVLRPLAGKGLSSWVARLAVHNFVTPGSFKAWLGCGDDDDLAADSGLIASLAGMTCLETGELRRRFE